MEKRGISPFLERIREAIRVRRYSIRTKRTYIEWTRLSPVRRNFRLYHPSDQTASSFPFGSEK